MIIRKLFTVENSHIVRNCSSDRCKRSIHGHSYTIEILFTSDHLDNGGMLVDFGIMKNILKPIIDSWDHAHAVWSKDDSNYIEDMRRWSARFIETPLSPSAESMSLMFVAIVKKVIESVTFNNGEGEVKVHSVKVHETATGYAESFASDLESEFMPSFDLNDIKFSQQIKDEWPFPTMYDELVGNLPLSDFWVLETPTKQV